MPEQLSPHQPSPQQPSPQQPTPEVILHAGWKQTVLPLLISALFATVGGVMVHQHAAHSWFVFGAFGLGVVLFLVQLIPGCAQLRLTGTGFEITSLFRTHSYRWQDVDHFAVTTLRSGLLPGPRHVAWNFSPRFDRSQAMRAVAKGLAGYEAMLPNNYGLSAEDLAVIMNASRLAHSLELANSLELTRSLELAHSLELTRSLEPAPPQPEP